MWYDAALGRQCFRRLGAIGLGVAGSVCIHPRIVQRVALFFYLGIAGTHACMHFSPNGSVGNLEFGQDYARHILALVDDGWELPD